MMGISTAQHSRWGRRFRLAMVFMLCGFFTQAAVGYWLLYRSISAESADDVVRFDRWPGTADETERRLWSASISRAPGRLKVNSNYKDQFFSRYWQISPSQKGDLGEFAKECPRTIRRLLLDTNEGIALPRQPWDSTVYVEACGWPMLSLMAWQISDRSVLASLAD